MVADAEALLRSRLDDVLPSGRKTLIIPVDHGLAMGNLAGLEDPRSVVVRLRDAGVHGTIMSPGLARRLRGDLGEMSLILAMDTQLWSEEPGHLDRIMSEIRIGTIAQAQRLGASALKVLFPWGLDAETIAGNIRLIAHLADEAEGAGFPLIVEPLWMGPAASPREFDRHIVHGARIAMELGADILKVPAVGLDALEKILVWGVPTVFLGGAKTDDTAELYERIRDGLAAGASGVVIGRNAWQRPDLAEALAEIRSLLG